MTQKTLNTPKNFLAMRRIWKTLKERLENFEDVPDQVKALIEQCDARLAAACFAFEPIIDRVFASQIDRLGSVLLGPVFSSAAHPWPSESGFPMMPIIQLDLRTCSSIGGISLGDGLLQVFMGHAKSNPSDAVIRFVPHSHVSPEALTQFSGFPPNIVAFADISWAENFGNSSSLQGKAQQIRGFGSSKFTMQEIPSLRDNFDLEDLVSLDIYPNEVDEFDQMAGDLASGFHPSGFYLFGTFEKIQYGAEDRPRVLFNFVSDLGYNFGDGNAQIFFERRRNGSVIFTFDWSCY